MPSGGARTPSSPAPVSGPGALSARTDGGPGGQQPVQDLPNAQYGENRDYVEQQQGAPLAQSPSVPTAPSGAGAGGGPAASVPGFGDATARPDEPVTEGAALGDGNGVEAMNFPNQRNEDYAGVSDALPFLSFMADQPGSSWAARNAVRKMQANQQ